MKTCRASFSSSCAFTPCSRSAVDISECRPPLVKILIGTWQEILPRAPPPDASRPPYGETPSETRTVAAHLSSVPARGFHPVPRDCAPHEANVAFTAPDFCDPSDEKRAVNAGDGGYLASALGWGSRSRRRDGSICRCSRPRHPRLSARRRPGHRRGGGVACLGPARYGLAADAGAGAAMGLQTVPGRRQYLSIAASLYEVAVPAPGWAGEHAHLKPTGEPLGSLVSSIQRPAPDSFARCVHLRGSTGRVGGGGTTDEAGDV